MASDPKPTAVYAAEVKHWEALAAFYDAQSLKTAAETKKEVTEGKRLAAEARKLTAEATEAEIELDVRQEKRKYEKSTDHYFHIYAFTGAVTSSTVASCILQLNKWVRNEPGIEIEIQFNSPGGSVVDGLALYDFIQSVRKAGHKVTTSTIGYAASMGGILLQAGDVRVMGAESWLLIHEVSFGAGGKISEVEDTTEWLKRVQNRIVDIFANRCQTTSAPKKLTKASIKRHWRRTDWWIDSDEALAYGLVDEVR
jgi:ATP-dependent Clp endopeptidase proteolytic subunit ClpP